MFRNLLILILALASLSGCRKDTPVLRIAATSEARDLLLNAALKYQEAYPGRKIRIYDLADDPGMDSIDLIIRPSFEIQVHPAADSPSLFASLAILTVFSSEHPDIQHVARSGVSPSLLASVYRGEVRNWNMLVPGCSEAWISVCMLPPSHAESKKYLDFLSVSPDTLVQQVSGPGAMSLILANDALSLGYLGSNIAFDGRTGFRRTGLYMMPMDLDTSGRIEDREFIYDDLKTFTKAVNAGLYPEALLIPYTCEPGLAMQAESNSRDFISWYKTNGSGACLRAGFIFPDFP